MWPNAFKSELKRGHHWQQDPGNKVQGFLLEKTGELVLNLASHWRAELAKVINEQGMEISEKQAEEAEEM